MTDMHIHILPGVDDGASSWEEALAMARIACADGIDELFCTPHMNADHDDLLALREHARLREEFKELLAEENIPMTLYSGAEWMLTPDLIDVVDQCGRLGEGQAFLFELSPYMPPDAARLLLTDARRDGFRPVLAHPERHPWIDEKNCLLLGELVDRGCTLQLTAGSLTGEFGSGARKVACAIARTFPDAIVLASDAHHAGRRKPELAAGYNVLDRLLPDLASHARNTLHHLLNAN